MANADRIIDLLHEAKARPAGAERARFLDGACSDDAALKEQIVSLLEADANEGGSDFLRICAMLRPAILPAEKAGDRIGRYKLLEQIGEGGCGIVYMAEQEEPVRRRVALKVIKLGMDTKQVIARFEAERQALAMMDHPNIAKVLDAGATETGRPYFVMELVRGIKITDYCDQNNLATKERLGLFIQVCQAIQHAHQKGIIHRDIKSSNILVTHHDDVAVPKVIDFGIAKATTGQLTDKTVFTAFAQFVGTPAYMSPEQAQMSGLDIDTRADIYSLGVLLYELLTGHTPFDAKELLAAGMDEMRRKIREDEPAKPSTCLSTMQAMELTTVAKRRHAEPPKLIHLIRGDLDWLVMKCLEKDRKRRYETASALALDLQRHLNDEPVVARPPSFGYQAGKLVRRHKGAVAAVAAVVLALIAGLVSSTVLFLRERTALVSEAAQRTAAEKHARAEAVARMEAETISAFFTDLFWTPDTEEDGLVGDFDEFLARAGQKLGADLDSLGAQPIKVQEVLGATYYAYGLHQKASSSLEMVKDGRLAALGPKHPDTLRAMTHLASAYLREGRRDEGIKMEEEVLTRYIEVLGREHDETVNAMSRLANSYARTFRYEDALTLREETLALKRKKFGAAHPDTLLAVLRMAESYGDCGRMDEAHSLLTEFSSSSSKATYLVERVALKITVLQAWFARNADHAATSRWLLTLPETASAPAAAERAVKGYCLLSSSDPQLLEAAVTAARRARQLDATYTSSPHFQMALGMAEYRQGSYAAADEALKIAEQPGRNSPHVRNTARFFHSMSLFRQGKAAEARDLFAETAAKMKPLPADERQPLANEAKPDDIIVWLAYKEAKALLQGPVQAE